jgi:hypothetical protein
MKDIGAILTAGILAILLSVSGLTAQSSPYSLSDEAMKKELENFKVFIQEHPRALAELKKDPSLIRSAAFAEEHQVVREYLEQHAKVKDELQKYPHFFDDLKATTQGGQHKSHPPDK